MPIDTATEPLSTREHDVLKTIVEDYIATATPVGSRAVSKHSGLRLSPASMRTVMADLTDKGYLEQPHTSAGRIPTALAFRLYPHTTLRPRPLPEEARERIQTVMTRAGQELTQMLHEASRLMAGISGQVSMVVSPGFKDARWKEIDFVLARPRLAVAMLALEGGGLQSRLLPLDEDCTQDDLQRFANYLNEHFRGQTLSQARRGIREELADARRRLSHLSARALSLARLACDQLEHLERRDVFVEGAANMLRHAEFADLETMRELLTLLEERSRLLDILDRALTPDAVEQLPGLKITFGQDALAHTHGDLPTDFRQCGVISTAYGQPETPQGAVAVIGPLRMDYANILPAVDYIAQTLTTLLSARY